MLEQKSIGEQIIAFRKKKGWTQEQLAGFLGVTYQAVSKWETGISYPDIMLLPKIAELFEITIDCLFGIGAKSSEKQQKESRQYSEQIEFLPWEDDGIIRVGVFDGKKLLWKNEKQSTDKQVQVYLKGEVKNVVNYGNVICDEVKGDIISYGSMHCNQDIHCHKLEGEVHCDGDVKCEKIQGNISAGGSISCEEIYGNVSAGANVNCENIHGDVSAGGSVNCDTMVGNTAKGKGLQESNSVHTKNKTIYIQNEDDEYSKEINKTLQEILEGVSQTLDDTAKSLRKK